MLDNGPHQKSPQLRLLDSKDNRLYFGAVSLAMGATAIAALLVLISPNATPTVALHLWLQVAIALLVLAFTVIGDQVVVKSSLEETRWLAGATIVAVVVLLVSIVAGEYLTVLLAPLMVGLAQRRREQQFLIQISLAAIAVILLEHLLLVLIGWNNTALADEQGSVAAIIVISTISLSLAALIRNYGVEIRGYQKEQESKASEMEVAHEIQTALMPPNEITNADWTVSARSIPARDVGGDFYEYIPHLGEGIGGVAIGDVAGKGIPAALQMAVVRTLLRVEARRRIFPAETLMSVNMALQAERSFGMVTLLYGFIDQSTSTIHLSNAGHNYPIILNGSMTEVRMPGLPLGIDDGIEYDEKQVRIEPGTSVIFYTDGVIEAMNVAGDLYGFGRLQAVVRDLQNYHPREMVDKILADVAIFTENAPQSDDITVVVIQHHRDALGSKTATSSLRKVSGALGEGNWI